MEANTKLREGVNIRNRDETHELFEEFQHSNAYYSGYEGDDEVFVEFDQLKPGDREEVRQPRVRRISDVIDSIGEMSSSLGRSHSLEFSESTSISSETSKVIECSTIRETSRFIITEVDGKEKLLSPPATPSSDLGYYSTGISTPPSQLNFKGKLFRFSNSSMEAASPPKWDTTDAKPYSG
ncbi:hypothetical protein AAG570_006348 [Ranatra chinensis]|uniref:Uncharacterized protein n=1 Tax=Ranatra chinensis TaxID=642074 RepID=A0ABD0ZGY4_9HEMI